MNLRALNINPNNYLKKALSAYLSAYKNVNRPLQILLLATFIDAIGQVLPLFLALFLAHRGAHIHIIGIVVTIFGFGSLFGGFAGGVLSDRYNARKFLIITLLLNSFFLSTLILPLNLIYFSFIVCLLGGLSSAIRPALIMLLNKHATLEDKSRIFGLRRVVLNFGISFAAFLGGWLSSVNLNFIFLLGSVASMTAAITVYLYLRVAEKENLITPAAPSTKTSVCVEKNNLSKFTFLCFILFCNLLVFAQLKVTYPLYMQDNFKLSVRAFSYLFAFSSLLIVLIEVPVLNLLKKVNRELITGIGALLMCGGFAILPVSHSIVFAYLGVFIWTLGEILFFPTLLNLILNSVPEKTGKYMGIYQTMFGLAMLIGPFVGTILYPLLHGDLLWLLSGAVGILSLFALTFINHKIYASLG